MLNWNMLNVERIPDYNALLFYCKFCFDVSVVKREVSHYGAVCCQEQR